MRSSRVSPQHYVGICRRLAERLQAKGRLLEFLIYPEVGHMQGHDDHLANFKKVVDTYLKA